MEYPSKNNHINRRIPISKDDLKKAINYPAKTSSQLYRRLNTEADQNKIVKGKLNTRKVYCVSRGNIQRASSINRKSYSRQCEIKILNEKSHDQQNRFTINDYTLCKPQIKETHIKKTTKNQNKKTYKSPLQKKNQHHQILKATKFAKSQRRVITEANDKDRQYPLIDIIEQIGEGTFGKVYKARYIPTGQIVAVKKVYQDPKYKSRQMQIIKMINSPFIMKTISSYIIEQGTSHPKNEYLNIVMDFYECNLFQYINNHPNLVNTLTLKVLLYQMFRGLMYIHSLSICHRDIKPHNILIKNGTLCLCDFGSAKILKKNEVSLSYICSRCYRAPELIFGCEKYTTQIDIWSSGCIILQILNKVPLFIGENSLDHLVEVIKVMGTPTKSEVLAMNSDYDLSEYDFPIIKKTQWPRLFPNADHLILDLVNKVMRYSPNLRLTAAQALAHQYFDEIRDEKAQISIKQIVNPKYFFQFTQQELKMINSPALLIPKWVSKTKSQ